MKYKGLTKEEVKERKKKGLVNYDTTPKSKTIKEILKENTFTLFNFINLVLAVLVLCVGSYKNLLFLGVVICNTLISTIQEVRAKKIIDKLSVINEVKAKVIRDNERKDIHINEIVLDDVILYELGNQIISDSIILDGTCEVNESFITGEAETIIKKEGDTLLSGSFIVSGNVTAKVIHVGLDNYTAVISRDAKTLKTEINSEIMRSLNKIIKYLSFALIPIGILLLIKQFSIEGNTTSNAIVSMVAAVIGMIPEGLVLLVSTVLSISVVKLSKYKVLVQDIYATETLSRVDTICLDKTGTITEGVMEIYDVIPYKDNVISEIDEILEGISTNLNDNNPTFNAINEKYGNDSLMKVKKVIPFSSDKKYSGIELEDKTYLIGAPEFILNNISKYKEELNELSKENRVLALVKEQNNRKSLMAYILIRDKIRSDASEIIEYFNENDVSVKVISGDNPITVSNIAKSVGINVIGICDATTIDESTDINKLVEENNIFGRVRPEQKRLLIKALKNNGHIVAMTGDGVNDVLALKEADCGIAMNSGSDAARNVSEFVLMNSDFAAIPPIIHEGRKAINNIERSATLFLSKTIYASLLAIIFLFIDYAYPFLPIQMSIINGFTIGVPAFILALEGNYERVKKNFLYNVISKAIPSGLTTVINIVILVFLTGLFNIERTQVSTLAVIVTAYTAMLLIYRISKPLNLFRKTLISILSTLFIMSLFIPLTRNFYSLDILRPNSVIILVIVMYLSTKLFWIFSNMLNYFLKRRRI